MLELVRHLFIATVIVTTNGLKTCTSATLEACANATVFTKAILGARDGRPEVSRTRVSELSGTKDSISFKGQNMILPNTQSINGL